MFVAERVGKRRCIVSVFISTTSELRDSRFCYFVSNNCVLLVIRDLGASLFQTLNNLKILFVALLMQYVMKKHYFIRSLEGSDNPGHRVDCLKIFSEPRRVTIKQ